MFVQVERHGSRRELKLPAEKTVSYINLFTVSVHGFVGGLELIEWTSCIKQLRRHRNVMTQSKLVKCFVRS